MNVTFSLLVYVFVFENFFIILKREQLDSHPEKTLSRKGLNLKKDYLLFSIDQITPPMWVLNCAISPDNYPPPRNPLATAFFFSFVLQKAKKKRGGKKKGVEEGRKEEEKGDCGEKENSKGKLGCST